ncbi:TonB-dependent receptor [Stenotrophobium rhamnosiphilum]|uniref:TonB-dependent receptor n=1 Tax=Stenotrophobium rhamnosiphilum TaxID=2029166 RepID=A0A2T5MKF8_9GAMM|nr:TonB-dependent receptor [Stenotrophobium rhamnosiphilum]PTU33050.1 TonB-dependent receptor [Stenotrophobium rhamnosiphilum]
MFTLNPLARALRLPSVLLLSIASGFISPASYAANLETTSADEGAVEGHLRDSAGSPFAKAEVRLLDSDGTLIGSTIADDKGHFHFHGLKAGSYHIVLSRSGYVDSDTVVVVTAGQETHTDVQLVAKLTTVTVTAERLEHARNSLSPSTGSSQYVFDQTTIANLPQGKNTPMNQLLLQAPGVANDSFGQLHVRGDHADLQYRINGIIIPEGISGFGQALDTRFANQVSLLTGALPAQYGYRTAGIVNITTPNTFDGGSVSVYGGSHGTFNPSIEYGTTTKDGVSMYGTGQFLNSLVGVEAPTDSYHPIHDQTQQGKGFGYLSFYPAEDMKVSVLAGTSFGKYQIPNNPGQSPDADFCAQLGGSSCGFDSSNLNDRQYERNTYGLVALQGQSGTRLTYQVAAFSRISSVEFSPDTEGELAFNGVAADIYRRSTTAGLQSDIGYRISDDHTLRGGVFFSNENDVSNNTSQVFTTDAGGNVNGGPVTIIDNNPKSGNHLFGVYAQDEWDITDDLTLNYGLRYDKLNAYINASQLSPRFGMIWNASTATVVHAGYSRYFTPPPNELISNATISKFDNTTNAQSGPNDPVQAERTHYFDIGATHQFTPNLNIGVDSYYKIIHGLLDEGQFGSALIYTPFNYAKGRIYGIEMTTSYRDGAFSAYNNMALSRAQGQGIDSAQFNIDPAALAYTQSHYIYLDHDQRFSGSAGVSYVYENTTYSLTDLYASGLRTDGATVPNGDRLPFYNQLDASAQRSVITPGLGKIDLRLAVINLLDRQYEIRDGEGVGVGAPQFGPRAGVFLGIKKDL